MITSSLIASFLVAVPIDNSFKDNSIIGNKTQEIFKEFKIKESDAYSQVFKELNSYKDLKTNWDGYGGIRPTDEIINSTKKFLEKLKENKILTPSIMVAGSGEIAIFWESKDSYIEVNFDTQEQFSFFYKIDDNIYGEDDIKVDNLPIRLKEALNYLESGVNSENDFFIIQNVA